MIARVENDRLILDLRTVFPNKSPYSSRRSLQRYLIARQTPENDSRIASASTLLSVCGRHSNFFHMKLGQRFARPTKCFGGVDGFPRNFVTPMVARTMIRMKKEK